MVDALEERRAGSVAGDVSGAEYVGEADGGIELGFVMDGGGVVADAAMCASSKRARAARKRSAWDATAA